VITPFPGGVAASASKIGSRYSFSIASTYEKYCPTLRGAPGVETALPDGVNSVMEIIVNGRDIQAIADAVQAAISAAVGTPGLIRISAGNYDGRLGKSFIYLRADRRGAGPP
jgi:formylmethanofuran--tetrahydromethanopterin N-formyltransferase